MINTSTAQCSHKGTTTGQACSAKSKVAYTCPMDKGITSDKPGKCSKCGMDLVKQEVKSGCNCPATCECCSGKACNCGASCKCPMCGKSDTKKSEVNKSGKISAVSCNCPSTCGCKDGKVCNCGASCTCAMCGKADGKIKTASAAYSCPDHCGCSSGAPCKCPKCGKDMIKKG